MLNKIGIWLFAILGSLTLIGVIIGDDEPVNNKAEKSKSVVLADVESENSKAKKYSNLPIKLDLSYFSKISNLTSQEMLDFDKSSLSIPEDKAELRGVDVRGALFHQAFNINSSGLTFMFVRGIKINSKSFSEFEMDDFDSKLKEEFSKSISNIRKDYKNVDRHIRIINLNIPVKYTKINSDRALVIIKDAKVKTLKKLGYVSKPITFVTYVKAALNNEYISNYIIPYTTTEKNPIKVTIKGIDLDADTYFKVEVIGDVNVLNDIGKTNNGNDVITELTLQAWNSTLLNYRGRYVRDFTYGAEFLITSFKLKSSDKRFVVNKVTPYDTVLVSYSIAKDNVKIHPIVVQE